MKVTIVLLFLLLLFVHPISAQKCVKGKIEYSVATYADEMFVKEKYGLFLDSILKAPVFEYFCIQDIQHLPTKAKVKDSKGSRSESHVIEPLFIDLANFNGIYGRRIWSLDPKARKPIRFRCGFYHGLFIMSNNKYVDLTNDTVKNETLIRKYLRSDFGDEEISRIVEYFKYGELCDHYTYFPPFYIKKGREVLFDAKEIAK